MKFLQTFFQNFQLVCLGQPQNFIRNYWSPDIKSILLDTSSKLSIAKGLCEVGPQSEYILFEFRNVHPVSLNSISVQKSYMQLLSTK